MDVNDNFTQSVHQAQMDRIAELEADNERWKDWHSRFTDDYLELRLLRAEKAEAHAADCKRLVTSCEDDIDMLRLRCREREAERDRARYGLDRQTKRADEAEANAQHWAESSKKFHDLADDWRMSFKREEMRAEEAEAERDRLEKENREMFRQLLGAGETFNKMNAELRELQSNGKAP